MKWDSFQYRRAKAIRSFDSGLVLIARYFSLGLAAVGLTVIIASWFIAVASVALALSYLVLSPAVLLISYGRYISYLKNHPGYGLTKERQALQPLNHFDFEALNLLARWRGHDSWQGLWQVCLEFPKTAEPLYRLGITPETILSLGANEPLNDAAMEQFIAAVVEDAANQPLATAFNIIHLLLNQAPASQFLQKEKVSRAETEELLSYYVERQLLTHQLEAKHFTGGFAKSWAVSYTNVLDQFTEILSPVALRQHAVLYPLFGRTGLVTEMVRELNKSANHNLAILGMSGVGKDEVFYHFASAIANYETKTPLDGKEIRLLHTEHLLAQIGDNAQAISLLEAVFAEILRAGNTILFVDNIDLLLEPSHELGTANLAGVLQNYLNSELMIIGTTTPEKYLKLIKNNPLLNQQIAAVEVPEPSVEQTVLIVLSHLYESEHKYDVFFLYSALHELANLARRYLKDSASPKREIDLLEEIAADVHAKSGHIVDNQAVRAVIEQKAKVPLQVDVTEQQTLLNLPALLHQRIVGQDYAITEVSQALLRARAGLSASDRPIGTFLFLGPTGVGKTETAKTLAQTYFGSDQKLIRLDMTEYADTAGLEKLLGTDAQNQPGALTLAIQQNPSAVVLFDEIEKASSAVKNVLLQLLDEGRLTTNFGKVLDFTNTIVIATSNAGSDIIRDQILKQTPVAQFQAQLSDYLIRQKIFAPEFLNRFDGVIVFAPLSPGEIEQVVEKEISKLSAQLQNEKGLQLQVAPTVVAELAKLGYDPVFGARALQRVLKDKLETTVAKQIVATNPAAGSTITVTAL